MTIKKKPAKMGRPEMGASERKNVVAQFRVTPAERKRLDSAAKKDGKKLSDWLRERALAEA